MARTTCVYLSKQRDADLYALVNEIGLPNFRKCMGCCLLSLVNPDYIIKAKEFAREKVKNGTESYQKYAVYSANANNVGIKIRVSLNSKKYSTINELIREIKPGSLSLFLKTLMRQVLGPQVLMQYFLIENSQVIIDGPIYYTSMIQFGNGVQNKTKRKYTHSDEYYLKKKRKATKTEEPDKEKMFAKVEIPSITKKEDAPSFTLPTEPVKAPIQDAPSFSGPSFGSAPTTDSGIDYKEDITNQEDASSDDDLLSMLEAMMS